MEELAFTSGLILPIAIFSTLFMAWGIGSNDLANSIGLGVGSRSFGIKEGIIIAIIFECAGAIIYGSQVSGNLVFDLIEIPEQATQANSSNQLVYIMLASLLATSLWLVFASARGWPVSTTHSMIGAILGATITAFSFDAIKWERMSEIISSWVISPLLGALLAFILMQITFVLVLRRVNPIKMVHFWMPVFFFFSGFFVAMITASKGFPDINITLEFDQMVIFSSIIGTTMAFISITTQKIFTSTEIEDHFIPLTIVTSCSMAFAHGSNDIANIVTPLAVLIQNIKYDPAAIQYFDSPGIYYLLGLIGIIAGMLTFGFRVIKTIGTGITALTPSSVFCASMAAAGTIVLATQLGFPISTTHTLVGALLGVGFANSIQSIHGKTLKQIVMAWLITLPVTSILAAILIIVFPLFV